MADLEVDLGADDGVEQEQQVLYYEDDLPSPEDVVDLDEVVNMDFVYALHTFVATLEGQVCVFKGDPLVLLDDSNSYWWLVKAVKSDEIGYIPAENIEVRDVMGVKSIGTDAACLWPRHLLFFCVEFGVVHNDVAIESPRPSV